MSARHFVVAVSGTCGSGYKTLGKKLAEELGIRCYDEDFLVMSSGSEVDETQEFVPDDEGYAWLSRAIQERAGNENCVLTGRAAAYVLREKEGVMRVFLYARKEDCQRRIIQRYRISQRDAEARRQKIDSYRAAFCRYHENGDWTDARRYDLCLDTAGMDSAKLVSVVKNYIWNRFSGSEERGTVQPLAAEKPKPAPRTEREERQRTARAEMRREVQQRTEEDRRYQAQEKERGEVRILVSGSRSMEPGEGIADINTRFEAFLDARSANEKYQILRTMRDEITDHLIDQMAASLDLVIEGKDTDDRYIKLRNAVATRSKYELERNRQ